MLVQTVAYSSAARRGSVETPRPSAEGTELVSVDDEQGSELSPEQLAELRRSVEQADRGEVVSVVTDDLRAGR